MPAKEWDALNGTSATGGSETAGAAAGAASEGEKGEKKKREGVWNALKDCPRCSVKQGNRAKVRFSDRFELFFNSVNFS